MVCHGGDHYVGKFPEDGTGAADVGGHFLWYDVGDFEFSSKFGLRQKDQEQAIYYLNQNVLNAGPTSGRERSHRRLVGEPTWLPESPEQNLH